MPPEGELRAAIVQDAESGRVLMLAWMDEEAVEVVTAALSESDERVVSEAADLIYHLYVLLAARGLDVAAVDDELRRRAS